MTVVTLAVVVWYTGAVGVVALYDETGTTGEVEYFTGAVDVLTVVYTVVAVVRCVLVR